MAKKEVYSCDKCGGSADIRSSVTVTVDVFTDAAGARDTDQRAFDLCGTCCRHELQKFLGRLDFEKSRDFCEAIEKRPFRDRYGKIRMKNANGK